jgi:leucyl aminopeptidase
MTEESLAGIAPSGEGALPLFALRPDGLEQLLAALAPRHATQARAQGFTAGLNECLLLTEDSGVKTAILGLGDGPALHGFGAGAQRLPAGSVWRLQPGAFTADEAALGFLLGAYRFTTLKSAPPKPIACLAPESVSARARIIAAAMTLSRDLVNMPANRLGPAELADTAVALGGRFSAEVERVNGAAFASRYPAAAAVAGGSVRGGEVVILTWSGSTAGESAPKIALCGKGVCFDTGGYDLKPSAAMLRMKKDMGGAAITLGVAQAVMALDLPVHLRVAIGCVENSVSGHAMRPSDVLATRAGLTVEVGNTDAEGRLVLCDLLAEAAALAPTWLIDTATLTGAARVALGPDLPALFCNDEELSAALLAAGNTSADPLWRLPLHDGYASWLDSPVADLNNVSSKPFAGAITAALFLQRFVTSSQAWAHIDVYCWNDSTRPGRPEGGEAQTLRALLAAIETRARRDETGTTRTGT